MKFILAQILAVVFAAKKGVKKEHKPYQLDYQNILMKWDLDRDGVVDYDECRVKYNRLCNEFLGKKSLNKAKENGQNIGKEQEKWVKEKAAEECADDFDTFWFNVADKNDHTGRIKEKKFEEHYGKSLKFITRDV